MKIRLLLIALLLLPACGKETVAKQSYAYNFADSVTIIRELLKTDSLSRILEDADPEGLDRLINNFSPAQMALESEVLSCTMPVLVCFYQEPSPDKNMLEQMAGEFADRCKIIIIDGDAFFSIAQDFEVEEYPTFVLMNKREELARHVGAISSERLFHLIILCLN